MELIINVSLTGMFLGGAGIGVAMALTNEAETNWDNKLFLLAANIGIPSFVVLLASMFVFALVNLWSRIGG